MNKLLPKQGVLDSLLSRTFIAALLISALLSAVLVFALYGEFYPQALCWGWSLGVVNAMAAVFLNRKAVGSANDAVFFLFFVAKLGRLAVLLVVIVIAFLAFKDVFKPFLIALLFTYFGFIVSEIFFLSMQPKVEETAQ